MGSSFRAVATSRFERDVERLTKKDPRLLLAVQGLLLALASDPYNIARRHNIKKLTGVKPGQGQWRIRSGSHRLRYDVLGNDVILYSFKHRREAY